MHVLTVLDHPNPNSFSHAVAAQFTAGAEEAGHTTELGDLHAEGFDPLWNMIDANDGITPQIAGERARIERADAICLVFPLFWWGMPSMMKGWVDRVWGWGWAYDQLDDPTFRSNGGDLVCSLCLRVPGPMRSKTEGAGSHGRALDRRDLSYWARTTPVNSCVAQQGQTPGVRLLQRFEAGRTIAGWAC